MFAGKNIKLFEVRNGSLMRTLEDGDLDQLEVSLCAYQPKRYAELLCSLIHQLPTRPTNSWASLGMLLYEHLLIIGKTSGKLFTILGIVQKLLKFQKKEKLEQSIVFQKISFFHSY